MRVGFHLDDFLSVASLNFFSRIIGAIVRFVVITYGLLFMIIASVIFLVPVLIWMITPFVMIPVFLGQKPVKETEGAYFKTHSNNNLKKLVLLLFNHPEGKFVTTHLNLDYKNLHWYFNNQTDEGNYSDFEKNIVQKGKNLKLSELFLALSKTYKPLIELLIRNKITPIEVYQTAVWYELLKDFETPPLILNRSRIKSLAGIGHNWAYGYTVKFDEYSTDLTAITTSFPILVGREEEMKSLQQVLLKSERNNALIIGEPGLGRHILVETLAHRMLIGTCHPSLSHKRLLKLDMHGLVASAPTILEVKGLAKNLLAETEYA